MKGVKEVVVDGETINLKKGMFGWGVVYPWRNKDGSMNWFNFITGGSWLGFFFTLFIVAVIVLAIIDYSSILRIANECLAQQNMFTFNLG